MLESAEIVKQNKRTPEIIVEMAIVPFRPKYLRSTVQQARKDPGTPITLVIA